MTLAIAGSVTDNVDDAAIEKGVQYTIVAVGTGVTWANYAGVGFTAAVGKTFVSLVAGSEESTTAFFNTQDITCDNMVAGSQYTIRTLGTIDFSLVGGDSTPAVGETFTATKPCAAASDYVTRVKDMGCARCAAGKYSSHVAAIAASTLAISLDALKASTKYVITVACTDCTDPGAANGVDVPMQDATLLGASANTIGVVFTTPAAGTANAAGQTSPFKITAETGKDGRVVEARLLSTEAGACISCAAGTWSGLIQDTDGCTPCLKGR